eukprot:15360566-Ditylum_brightwellii.AAC.1
MTISGLLLHLLGTVKCVVPCNFNVAFYYHIKWYMLTSVLADLYLVVIQNDPVEILCNLVVLLLK